MMKRAYTILLASLSLTVSSALVAKGNGPDTDTGIEASNSQTIDLQYELGKSIYKSTRADGSRLEYCVNGDNRLLKLSRPAVKRFRNGLASDFVDSLYNCEDPAVKITDTWPVEQSDAILYYLNKRFKLGLRTD